MVSSSSVLVVAARNLVDQNIIAADLGLASITLFVFDFLLTFGREVELIWKQPRSFVTILFLLNRYLPLIDSVATFFVDFSLHSASICNITYKIQAPLSIIGICASEGILITRTVAVWDNNKRVFWMLLMLLVLCTSAVIGLVARYSSFPSAISSIDVVSVSDSAIDGHGCPGEVATGSAAIYLAGPWIAILAFETILICLTLPKALSYRRFGRTELYDAIYVNGAWFYICTLATSAANIIVLFYPTNHLSEHPVYLIVFDRILHSILASRLILSIRGAGAGSTAQTRSAISVMEFYLQPGSVGDHLDPNAPQPCSVAARS